MAHPVDWYTFDQSRARQCPHVTGHHIEDVVTTIELDGAGEIYFRQGPASCLVAAENAADAAAVAVVATRRVLAIAGHASSASGSNREHRVGTISAGRDVYLSGDGASRYREVRAGRNIYEDGRRVEKREKRSPLGVRGRVLVCVSLPHLESLRVAGSWRVQAQDLERPRLSIELVGTGDIRLFGRASALAARIGGAGNIDASKLNAVDAELTVAGTGNIRATVTHRLDAKVSGIGDIVVAGNPPLRDREIRGIGQVIVS